MSGRLKRMSNFYQAKNVITSFKQFICEELQQRELLMFFSFAVFIVTILILAVIYVFFINHPRKCAVKRTRKRFIGKDEYEVPYEVAAYWFEQRWSSTLYNFLHYLFTLGSVLLSLFLVYLTSSFDEKTKNYAIVFSMMALMFTICAIYFRFDKLAIDAEGKKEAIEACILKTIYSESDVNVKNKKLTNKLTKLRK
jgi:heme/copper-type cytochrome/quinol oxidase subunit 4